VAAVMGRFGDNKWSFDSVGSSRCSHVSRRPFEELLDHMSLFRHKIY